MKTIPRKGDYVKTSRHGHKGRVLSVQGMPNTAANVAWWDLQEIPVTEEERSGLWVSILCYDGGSVSTPLSCVSKIKPLCFDSQFSRRAEMEQFGNGL